MQMLSSYMVENYSCFVFFYTPPFLCTALQIRWSVCDSLMLVKSKQSFGLPMFPEGARPGLIYLINFKSDRLPEAARRCLFLSFPKVRYGALWKWEWGNFRRFSKKDQQRKVCVCVFLRGIVSVCLS